ncbi:hypothetical protein H3C70_05315 [Patescibacteria group bacterium]|nr:hypothetical protein [Patescibacteria group bacterium]
MPRQATSDRQFLQELQRQAELQSQLSTTRILPRHADWLTTLIGNHPWQTLVVISTVSTIVMFLLDRI